MMKIVLFIALLLIKVYFFRKLGAVFLVLVFLAFIVLGIWEGEFGVTQANAGSV